MVRVRPPEVSSFSPLFSPRLSPCSCLWGSDRRSRLFMAEREHCVSLLDSLSRPPCSVDTGEHLARHFHRFFSSRRRQEAFRFCLAGAVSLLCSASIPVLVVRALSVWCVAWRSGIFVYRLDGGSTKLMLDWESALRT
ncbi:hypothetical protein HID58_076878 [Brassica napus]|uniref:Transmembrane protein n=1 Tax=Brassica napus TaxID=3708 RepID=A0ABQ7YNT5_BRANA|nr:hypothetical protein HID58_076878 [Brassica napus]